MTVDAGPLVRSLCDQLDMIGLINEMVTWDPQRCKLSPGELIVALVIACFLRQRPLYKVFLSFETTDCELLMGRGVTPDDLNDDALGRALDKFAAGEPEKIFAAICARAAVSEAVDQRFLHWDSTTRSVYGDYAGPVGEDGVQVTHGHSKDYRNDLKQIMLSLLANREGFPLWGGVHAGNASDKKLNREVIAQIRDTFSAEQMRSLIHARQHVWKVGNAVFGQGSPAAAAWAEPLCQALLDEGAAPLLAAIGQLAPEDGDAAKEVRLGLEYFGENASRMRYPEFTAAGLPVGSGMVEGACKQVVQAREKGAGMRWRRKGAQAVASLRAVHRSGQWKRFWARQPQMRRPAARSLASTA